MCLIVDANVATQFFCTAHLPTSDLREAVFSGRCCVVYGGKLRREYEKIEKARRIVLALDRAGRARAVSDKSVDGRTKTLEEEGSLVSDDPHVIALALISGSRLLHSLDVALQKDFTNPRVVSLPRGKVYKGGANQRHLVQRHCRGC